MLYKFSKGTKNIVFSHDDMICVADKPDWFEEIMPEIERVDVYDGVSRRKKGNGQNVVKIFFADGTTETAILAEGDTFSLENGISICLTKRLLRDFSPGNESSVYNKLIQMATKVYHDGLEEKKEKKPKKVSEKPRHDKPKHKREMEALKDYENDVLNFLRDVIGMGDCD